MYLFFQANLPRSGILAGQDAQAVCWLSNSGFANKSLWSWTKFSPICLLPAFKNSKILNSVKF